MANAVNTTLYTTYHALRQQALALQAATNALPVHPAYINAQYNVQQCAYRAMCFGVPDDEDAKRPVRTITKKQKLQAFAFLTKALHSKQ